MTQQADGTVVLVAAAREAVAEKVYHTAPKDCPVIESHGRDHYREVPRESLTDDWGACRRCSDRPSQSPPGPGTAECPRCQETVTNLGQHLRYTCDGVGR